MELDRRQLIVGTTATLAAMVVPATQSEALQCLPLFSLWPRLGSRIIGVSLQPKDEHGNRRLRLELSRLSGQSIFRMGMVGETIAEWWPFSDVVVTDEPIFIGMSPLVAVDWARVHYNDGCCETFSFDDDGSYKRFKSYPSGDRETFWHDADGCIDAYELHGVS